MNTRQNIITSLNGETPETTPLTFYSWMFTGDCENNNSALFTDKLKKLYDQGLGICHHCRVVREIQHGVKDTIENKNMGNDAVKIHIKETPIGSLRQVFKNGWHTEYWIKTPEDYKIMTWIMRHTELVADYQAFARGEQLVCNQGIAVILGSRTPAMSINVDWAGTERFCMDLAYELSELFELYEARKKLFVEETKLIAAGPGRFVKWLENLTINMIGPQKYEQLLISIYNQCVPILESAGKRVMVHYDGALNVIADQIARSSFHIIDSLTEPPEGDMMYDQCRLLWHDKVFWANINVDLYYESEAKLRQAVIDKRNRAGKIAFAFEISEDMPTNFETSIPVVLDTLAALK